jgi:hypothetical protein
MESAGTKEGGKEGRREGGKVNKDTADITGVLQVAEVSKAEAAPGSRPPYFGMHCIICMFPFSWRTTVL